MTKTAAGPCAGWAIRSVCCRRTFPGKSLVEVAQRLLEQRDPVKYVQTLDFKPDWVSCEYHTAYQQPSMDAEAA